MARVPSIVVAALAAAGLALAPAARAQTPDHQHDHPADADHSHAHSHAGAAVDCTSLAAPPWFGLSDHDLRQIAQLQQATAQLNTPEAARAAGFVPLLGNIPGMGVHYVHSGRTRAGVTAGEPDHLLFAPVNGEEQLVGVAYAFRDVVETTVPLPFESELAAWHDHPELGGPGQTLHMLHVWFVPSSNGPFAGLNFWLPFRGAGIQPPNPCWVQNDTDFERIQQVSFALAATQNEEPPFGGLLGGGRGDLAGLIAALGGGAGAQGRAGAGGLDPERLAALAGSLDPAQLAALLEQFGGRSGGAGAGAGAAGPGARRAALAGARAPTGEAAERRAGLIAALDAAAKADDRQAWLQAADAYLADLSIAERTTVNGLLRSLTLAQLSTPEREAIRQGTDRP